MATELQEAEVVREPAEERGIIQQRSGALSFATSKEESIKRLRDLQEFVHDAMVEGEDFGKIPGIEKPTLLKPGAEKLAEIYGLTIEPTVTHRLEDWERGFFNYEFRVVLRSRRTGDIIGVGCGSCNSKEATFRWRDARRKCPACGAKAIVKGREEYGGGWLCFAKKGGCGAKFQAGDVAIEGQQVGRVENDDIYSVVNTILKRAEKRAVVDAVLRVTRSSALFTQDLEEMDPETVKHAPPAKPAQKPASKPAPQPTKPTPAAPPAASPAPAAPPDSPPPAAPAGKVYQMRKPAAPSAAPTNGKIDGGKAIDKETIDNMMNLLKVLAQDGDFASIEESFRMNAVRRFKKPLEELVMWQAGYLLKDLQAVQAGTREVKFRSDGMMTFEDVKPPDVPTEEPPPEAGSNPHFDESKIPF